MAGEEDRLLLEKAAEQGDASSQRELGLLYLSGADGVPQDRPRGLEWLGKAAKQNDPMANSLFNVGATKDGLKDDVQFFLEQSAEQGEAWAQRAFAAMYLHGKGKALSNWDAAKWYRKAAEQGDAESQLILGLLYLEGDGVVKDCKMAAKWLRKAVEQGQTRGREYLVKAEAEIVADKQGCMIIVILVIGIVLGGIIGNAMDHVFIGIIIGGIIGVIGVTIADIVEGN